MIFTIFFLLSSCGIEEFVEQEYLNSPSDLTVYPQNNKIKIRFYSSNSEDKLDGFNIYISKSSRLKNKHGLEPVKNPSSGSIPTINRTSKEIDPHTPIEVTIDRDAEDGLIENYNTYYIIVRAHSIRNLKSQPSNEASTTPRIDNLDGIIIDPDHGFNFSSLNKSAPYNFVFKIIKYAPYLIAQNNSRIQNKGYYENWESINKAEGDEDNYVDSTTPLQFKQGHVFLIRTADSRYGKIQIKELNAGANPYIKIKWAFQQNYNNTDI